MGLNTYRSSIIYRHNYCLSLSKPYTDEMYVFVHSYVFVCLYVSSSTILPGKLMRHELF